MRTTTAGRRSVELGCTRCGQIAPATAARRGACARCGGELVAIHEPPQDLVRDYLYRPISLRAYRRPDRAEGRSGRGLAERATESVRVSADSAPGRRS